MNRPTDPRGFGRRRWQSDAVKRRKQSARRAAVGFGLPAVSFSVAFAVAMTADGGRSAPNVAALFFIGAAVCLPIAVMAYRESI